MPRICYVGKSFRPDSLRIIEQANVIVDEYDAQGFTLTLRQLYYQFVSRDLIPNTQRSYKRLGSIISDARLAGMIDWEQITDRTRNVQAQSHWDDPSSIIASAARSYGIDLWQSQDRRVEVWIEKDALAGVIENVCAEWDVSYLSCRGYVSQSEMWVGAQRFKVYDDAGQRPVVIHLGDHDPSGIDMTRDIQDRLRMLSGTDVEVRRIALSRAQVDQYGCPPNPAKLTDSRAGDYVEEHGFSSWELDALSPPTLVELIDTEIDSIVDHGLFEEIRTQQESERETLKAISDQYERVVENLES